MRNWSSLMCYVSVTMFVLPWTSVARSSGGKSGRDRRLSAGLSLVRMLHDRANDSVDGRRMWSSVSRLTGCRFPLGPMPPSASHGQHQRANRDPWHEPPVILAATWRPIASVSVLSLVARGGSEESDGCPDSCGCVHEQQPRVGPISPSWCCSSQPSPQTSRHPMSPRRAHASGP